MKNQCDPIAQLWKIQQLTKTSVRREMLGCGILGATGAQANL
jgi:hypothetical protein